MVSRVSNLTERLIINAEDFFAAISDSFKMRKNLSSLRYSDRDLRKKSHFVVGFTLVKQVNESQHSFVQLS